LKKKGPVSDDEDLQFSFKPAKSLPITKPSVAVKPLAERGSTVDEAIEI